MLFARMQPRLAILLRTRVHVRGCQRIFESSGHSAAALADGILFANVPQDKSRQPSEVVFYCLQKEKRLKDDGVVEAEHTRLNRLTEPSAAALLPLGCTCTMRKRCVRAAHIEKCA
jgi:hypothetical protein